MRITQLHTILISYCCIKFIDLFSQFLTTGLNQTSNHAYRSIKPNVSGAKFSTRFQSLMVAGFYGNGCRTKLSMTPICPPPSLVN